ncbi:MAG: DUF1553 domain-containing protein [Acidobacteriota bacterium]|nr:DUF1553 domain-containing protein [Acidobacteriota bacterium]
MWNLLLAGLLAAASLPAAGGPSVFETSGVPAPQNRIDELVFSRLKQLGIAPAALASDAVFLRRVYLDTTGSIPTAAEAAAFLADTAPDKRGVLIDRLLGRPEFADYQAMRWSDVLRIKAEFPINLWPNAAQAYYHWLRAAIRENLPYDQFARLLLTDSGSNFREPPVNFYRAMQSREPKAIARTVALTFMGARAEKWPAQRLDAMTRFFSRIQYKGTGEWKEEIVQLAPATTPLTATLPDGATVRIAADQDPRDAFARWLLAPGNPWFARAEANRVWAWLLGRGIVEEPDDIRDDNPPENPELLAYLSRELAGAKFDVRHLYRLILNSATYQLSPVPRGAGPDAAAPFACYPLRRLDAEVLIDALNRITGTGENYSSAIPEPYTWMPDDQRAVALPDGSITSSFLELFGRPPRDTGYASERNNRITDAQRLHLLNSSQVLNKIGQGPAMQALLRDNARNPQALVNQLYLTILSRYPSPEELRAVAEHSRTATAKGAAAAVDLAWALINSTEFLYRH